ncbi:MAG: hypothetical protein WBP95_05190, partial [Acidobacteriaceae bacterium]
PIPARPLLALQIGYHRATPTTNVILSEAPPQNLQRKTHSPAPVEEAGLSESAQPPSRTAPLNQREGNRS